MKSIHHEIPFDIIDETDQTDQTEQTQTLSNSDSDRFSELSFILKSRPNSKNQTNSKKNQTNSSKVYKVFITRTGAFLSFELLGDMVKRVKKHFTLTTQTITKQLTSLTTAILDMKKSRLIIPRFGLYEILAKYPKLSVNVISQLQEGVDVNFSWKGQLTSNQEIVVKEILSKHYTQERVAAGTAGVIVNLEAGQGKSFLAAYLIAQIKKKTAIILHSTALVDQWVDVIKKALGEQTKIGFYYTNKHQDGDVVILIVKSASMDTFEVKYGKEKRTLTANEYYSQFGFVIYDECHTYANHSAITAMRQAQAKYVLGLSATPDEHTKGFDKVVWWHLGPVLVAKRLTGYQGASEDFKATVHRIMYTGSPTFTKAIINDKIQTVDVSKTINMISEDPIRNEVIIECIIKLLRMKLNIFVFGDRREHLTHLKGLLESYISQQQSLKAAGRKIDMPDADLDMLIDNMDFTRIVGGSKADELEKAGQKSKVIFTTYSFMGTGKSVPRMNGLVLAHPRRSKMKQYIARIFRLGSDQTIERHIYDIVDMRLSIKNQWTTRKNYYLSKNYSIIDEKINFATYQGLGLDDGTFKLEENDSIEFSGVNDDIENSEDDEKEASISNNQSALASKFFANTANSGSSPSALASKFFANTANSGSSPSALDLIMAKLKS